MALGLLVLGYALLAWYAATQWLGRSWSTARTLAWFSIALTAIICATVLAAGCA